MSPETVLREKLATCTRILAMQQLMGLFGHISAYDPARQRIYFSPAGGADKVLVGADAILASDPAGRALTSGVSLPAEWPIHTVLHRRRNDALAIAHLHAPYATLFAIADRPFRPVTLQGSIFAGGLPLYREPHLVQTVAQGERLADCLADRPAAFMRGHGIVLVARDVEELLYGALILEDEARKWVEASGLGPVEGLSDHECDAFGAAAQFSNRAQRAWRYYAALEQRWDHNPGTGCVPFS